MLSHLATQLVKVMSWTSSMGWGANGGFMLSLTTNHWIQTVLTIVLQVDSLLLITMILISLIQTPHGDVRNKGEMIRQIGSVLVAFASFLIQSPAMNILVFLCLVLGILRIAFAEDKEARQSEPFIMAIAAFVAMFTCVNVVGYQVIFIARLVAFLVIFGCLFFAVFDKHVLPTLLVLLTMFLFLAVIPFSALFWLWIMGFAQMLNFWIIPGQQGFTRSASIVLVICVLAAVLTPSVVNNTIEGVHKSAQRHPWLLLHDLQKFAVSDVCMQTGICKMSLERYNPETYSSEDLQTAVNAIISLAQEASNRDMLACTGLSRHLGMGLKTFDIHTVKRICETIQLFNKDQMNRQSFTYCHPKET